MGSQSLTTAADALGSARNVVALTGAGVSAESGIATFRDPEEGLWAKYDPMELASIDAFHRDPELVTQWYHSRFVKCACAKPNAGHEALARIEQETIARGGRFTLITQNIDGLHQKAGSRSVIEIHGTILIWRCTKTGREVPIDDIPFDEFPPRSDEGGILRPNVVWFGEMLPERALGAALHVSSLCDLFMSVGTSAAVFPAAGFIDMAVGNGAKTIEINREPTPVSGTVDWSIMGLGGETLPRLADEAFGPAGEG